MMICEVSVSATARSIGGVDASPFEIGKGSSHDCALGCVVRQSGEVKGLKRRKIVSRCGEIG